MAGASVHEWLIFMGVVVVAVAADFLLLHRSPHRMSWKQALVEICLWTSLALAFAGWIWISRGGEAGLEFVTGYVVEESLSVDNVLLFLLIFRAFQISSSSEHKVLYTGLAGAAVFRAVFVFAGVALINHFRAILYVFGVFLIFIGLRMLFSRERIAAPEKNWLVRMAAKVLPIDNAETCEHFTVERSGRRFFTRLALALIAIEVTDIIFAVDSVPAVLAITRNPFIVYTSNIFAILSLRAMYFGLAEVLQRIRFLHQGLAAILVFVGGEMLLSGYFAVPTAVSLAVIAVILALTMASSRVFDRRGHRSARQN